MHYTYVLLSEAEGRFYTGYTADLRRRLGGRKHGRVRWTVGRNKLERH